MKKDQIVMVRRKQYHNTIRTKFDYKLANIITTNLNKKKKKKKLTWLYFNRKIAMQMLFK